MLAGVALFLPGWIDLAHVAVTWTIAVLLLLLGSAGCGKAVAAEFRIGAGWGVVCLVLTAWGVFLPWSLRIPAAGLVLLALGVLAIPACRPPAGDWRALGRLLAVTLPLWAVMAAVRPSQVDTFLNLLPNANYLVDYGLLPTAALPPSYSLYPAAPYDTQFLAFLGSFADPAYPASGMSLVNVMLRLVGGLAMARLLMRTRALSWSAAALGMLLATLFDPGFVPRFHFSSYGETGLAVTAVLAACLFAGGERAGTRHPLALSLILAAMINTKQSGIGLVLALTGAAIAAEAAERGAIRRRALVGPALVLLPAAALYLAWRYFVAGAGVAGLEPLPFGQWNWAVLPETVRSIGGAIAEKPVFFAAVAAALVCLPVLLRRHGWSPATRMLAFFAALFVLYNLFLMVTYIAHFSPEMSAEAHSYFRYNTHLSLVLVLGLALAVRERWPALSATARARRLAPAAVGLALLAPAAFAERLRFDIAMPQPLVWDLAARLKEYVGDGDRLALLTPGDDGQVGRLLADYLASVPPRRRGLDIASRNAADGTTLDEVAAAGYRLALISCTADGGAALLRHGPDGWTQVAAWAYGPGLPTSPWSRRRHWPALCG
ncbi:MAG: hypothetical protein JO258_00950 [Alphaproteobacteria bacterium]|nr:hypothetical protein [Alphaproteobacteria bacterium]